MSVIVDTDGLFCGKRLCCGSGKCLPAFIVESEGDNDLLVAHVILLIAGFCIRHLCSGDHCVAVSDDLVKCLGQDILDSAVLSNSECVVFVACIICLADEIQGAGACLVSDAGAARQIQTFFDVVIRTSVSFAKSDQHRVCHQSSDGRDEQKGNDRSRFLHFDQLLQLKTLCVPPAYRQV